MPRRRLLPLVCCILLGLLPSSGEGLPLLQDAEWAAYDLACRRLAATAPPSRAVLVLIDERSLAGMREQGERWPFPRWQHAPVLAWLQQAGCRTVVFDLLHPEEEDTDPEFAAALRQHGGAVLACTSDGAQQEGTPPWLVDLAGSDRLPRRSMRPLVPVAELLAAVEHGGHVDLDADRDGVVRRNVLVKVDASGRALPSLGLAAWLADRPDAAPPRLQDDGLELGGHHVPLSGDGGALLAWRRSDQDFPTCSWLDCWAAGHRLAAGEAPGLDAELFRGRIAFIGAAAAGTFDLRATPVDRAAAGVRIHATTFDNLDRGVSMQPPPTWRWLLLVLVLTAAAIGTLALPRFWHQLLLAGGLAVTWVLLAAALFGGGIWLPSVAPLLGLLLCISAATAINYLSEGRQRRFIRHAFQHYLASDVIRELERDPHRLRLGGERREITAFFTDLAGFTAISEQLEAEQLFALLNEYLSAMTDIVLDEGGILDKYIGDAIVAIFGAPGERPDHATAAVRAAVRCQRRLAVLRGAWVGRGLPELHMRIGIATGIAVVGNVGGETRFDYTMLGDTVNLAARLEAANKFYRSEILLSAATRDACAETIPCRQLDTIAVKGKRTGVAIWTPAADMAEAHLTAYREALTRYQVGDFSAAASAFADLAAASGDGPAGMLAERCRRFAEEPPPDWAGVWRPDSK